MQSHAVPAGRDEPQPGRRSPWTQSPAAWLALIHLIPSLWLLGAGLTGAHVLFFRDLTGYYYPAYVFLERAFEAGVWPLWIPSAQAGAPFLATYPIDLALVWLIGARWTLAVMPVLHLWIALCGASWLARRLGAGPAGAWVAGSAFGLSGYLLSTVNLLPLFQAAAWAPWVIGVFLAVLDRPSRRNVACLAVVSALQITTLAAEIVVQTALVGLALATWRCLSGGVRAAGALAASAALATALSAPAWAGLAGLLDGARARGFTPAEALVFSARPPALLEMVLPRFLGDVHSFSDVWFWGQPFFPEGYPYLLSLYVGPAVLLLALASNAHRRLWLVALLGLALATGMHGPLAGLVGPWWRVSRSPVKFLFMSTLALTLLAGAGFDRLVQARRRTRLALCVPGLALLGGALAIRGGPAIFSRLGTWVPELLDPRWSLVATTAWPPFLLATGGLVLAAGLALSLGGRWRWASALAVLLDLVLVNGEINTFADRRLLDLRPEVAAALSLARSEAAGRFLSFGGGGARWRPDVPLRARDTWRYAVERQTLSPWHNVLDGVDSALEIDRTGWSPVRATLTADQFTPSNFREIFPPARLAGVRWVLSFEKLPADLAREREQIPFPELQTPLRLHEIVNPLPLAFFVAEHEVVGSHAEAVRRATETGFDARRNVALEVRPPSRPAAAASPPPDATVRLERPDPHTVVVRATTPPGLIVVLEGYHRYWQAEGPAGPLPLLRANGRYWAIATAGGDAVFRVRFRPPWRLWALLAAGLGAMAVAALMMSAGRISPPPVP